MDLMMGLSAIKQTLEITKELRSVDKKIEDAELKLRLAEIVDKLLDAKKALIDAQEREVELRKEIGDLQSKQAMKAKLRDNNGLLFEIDDEGRNIGEPYCNLCAVRDEKYIRMRHHPAKQGTHSHYQCDSCKTTVITGPSLPRQPLQRRNTPWT